MDTLLLLLADGRFPAGGHAHSGGLEAAVAAGRVTGVADLAGFLRGRLATAGQVSAAFAAATHLATSYAVVDTHRPGRPGKLETGTALAGAPGSGGVAVLDAELDARTISPALAAHQPAAGSGAAACRPGRVAGTVPRTRLRRTRTDHTSRSRSASPPPPPDSTPVRPP